MCKYCEIVKSIGGKVCEETTCELMENLPIVDEFTEKEIVPHFLENPMQYIRRYGNKYSLITEFGSEDGTVLLLPINSCPMCGRRLSADVEQQEEIKGCSGECDFCPDSDSCEQCGSI